MNIGLLNIMHNKVWDFRQDLAQTYADALKNAIELHLPNGTEKQEGFFLSKKGYRKDGVTHAANFEEKLYVGDIRRIERHLYWNDEELQEDDQIINVVVVDGPVTRDGDGCSYGTKDFRDQVMYANTIPQVVGHLFVINTPGGQASCRNDYDMMIADCREKGKPTVAFVDGMCCSSGVNLACRCDRTIVMNPKDEFGCIGTMAAFWAVAHDTVDSDGYRYVELVGKDCPEKNDWYREAAKGEYEKLQAELDRDTEEFHNEVHENRPLVTDDMLTGKVFEAQEVIPALVDEIGDMNRAIECVFELAGEKLVTARLVTAEPKEDDTDGNPSGTVAEPEEIATPKNKDIMTEEEKKAQEAEAATAAAQEETPATEQPAEEAAPATEAPAVEEEKPAGAAEETPAADDEKPAEDGEPAEDGQPAGEAPATEDEEPATESTATEEPASEEAQAGAAAEIDKIWETLHNAEQMIADKDQEIASLKESLATLNGIAEERDAAVKERNDMEASFNEKDKALTEAKARIAEHVATIEKLNKQVGDLKAEVKELAGKPAPMTDAAAGIPADNGTGDAPKVRQKRITRENMTYENCRKVAKGE